MYLTDYRERCFKDVITQLEPGLFKKVTGLNVEDFNLLCSLGVFNAPLMNDAIFKFKRYEDASLSYTGINRHANDEVGGWDTTIRKTQYEKLFYNQQSSMTEVDYGAYSKPADVVVVKTVEAKKPEVRPSVAVSQSQPKPIDQPRPIVAMPQPVVPQEVKLPEDLEEKLEAVTIGSVVYHKTFGKGTVTKFNKNEQYIFVRFHLGGEKKFVFPMAFEMGFLEIK